MNDGSGDAGARASRRLMQLRDVLALEVTELLYQERPELLDRHGERGRAKCLQDMRYNIDQLIPAVDLDDASMFARYVEWLDALLRARRVQTRDVVRCLELLRERCAARLTTDETTAIGRIIDAGLDMVRP